MKNLQQIASAFKAACVAELEAIDDSSLVVRVIKGFVQNILILCVGRFSHQSRHKKVRLASLNQLLPAQQG